MHRGFKAEAERQAQQLRLALNLPPTAPLPAALLADHLGITIIYPGQVPGMQADKLDHLLRAGASSWSAVTIIWGNETLVIQNPTHSRARQESDLMHEMSHVLCNHQPTQFVRVECFPFPLRDYDPVQEEEATWLSGCLKLPRVALLQAVRQDWDDAMIMEHFGASAEMVTYRRQITGIDTQLARMRKRRS